MHKWLLVALLSSSLYAEIGEISELRGNGEILRSTGGDKLLAELALGIFSNDDVRTGNGRMALTFLDDSVLKLTPPTQLIFASIIFYCLMYVLIYCCYRCGRQTEVKPNKEMPI